MLEFLIKWFWLDDKVFSNFICSKVLFEIRFEENYMYVIKGLKKNCCSYIYFMYSNMCV